MSSKACFLAPLLMHCRVAQNRNVHLGPPETFILTLFPALKWSDFCLIFFYVIFDYNKPPFVSLYCFEIGPKSGRQDWRYKGAKIHLSGLTVIMIIMNIIAQQPAVTLTIGGQGDLHDLSFRPLL